MDDRKVANGQKLCQQSKCYMNMVSLVSVTGRNDYLFNAFSVLNSAGIFLSLFWSLLNQWCHNVALLQYCSDLYIFEASKIALPWTKTHVWQYHLHHSRLLSVSAWMSPECLCLYVRKWNRIKPVIITSSFQNPRRDYTTVSAQWVWHKVLRQTPDLGLTLSNEYTQQNPSTHPGPKEMCVLIMSGMTTPCSTVQEQRNRNSYLLLFLWSPTIPPKKLIIWQTMSDLMAYSISKLHSKHTAVPF